LGGEPHEGGGGDAGTNPRVALAQPRGGFADGAATESLLWSPRRQLVAARHG